LDGATTRPQGCCQRCGSSILLRKARMWLITDCFIRNGKGTRLNQIKPEQQFLVGNLFRASGRRDHILYSGIEQGLLRQGCIGPSGRVTSHSNREIYRSRIMRHSERRCQRSFLGTERHSGCTSKIRRDLLGSEPSNLP
jgi:hypothetical protein